MSRIGRMPITLPSGVEVTQEGNRLTVKGPLGTLERVLHPESGAEVVNLGQNHNRGWVARQSGKELSPLVLNGWQQGWVVEGDEPVVATYTPDPVYRAGLVVGLVALLTLVVTSLLWPFRRRRRIELPPLCGSELPTAAAVALTGVSSVLVAGIFSQP